MNVEGMLSHENYWKLNYEMYDGNWTKPTGYVKDEPIKEKADLPYQNLNRIFYSTLDLCWVHTEALLNCLYIKCERYNQKQHKDTAINCRAQTRGCGCFWMCGQFLGTTGKKHVCMHLTSSTSFSFHPTPTSLSHFITSQEVSKL